MPGALERYVPFDVDPSVVAGCADELTDLYPGLTVHGVVGDFSCHLGHVPDGERRLIAFLGSTIGNLMPAERAAPSSQRVREMMGPTDRFLLGTDLLKDVARARGRLQRQPGRDGARSTSTCCAC